jgi:hypothetical protein
VLGFFDGSQTSNKFRPEGSVLLSDISLLNIEMVSNVITNGVKNGMFSRLFTRTEANVA